DHSGIIFQLEQADVTMVILKGLQLQFGAFLAAEDELLLRSLVSRPMLLQLGQLEVEQSPMAEGALSVRPSLGVHLQEPEIDAELDFLEPILADEFSHDDLAGLVIPLFQE